MRSRSPRRLAVALVPCLFVGAALAATPSRAQETTTDPTNAGSLDVATFNPPDGFVTTAIGGSSGASGIVQQPSGRLVAAGTGVPGEAFALDVVALAGYDQHGSIDTTFGLNGITAVDVGLLPQVADVLLQGDEGALVTVGNVESSAFAVRHTASGFVDRDFGTDGRGLIEIEDLDEINAAAVQADGKIVVTGTSGNPFGPDGTSTVVARFTFDGQRDTTFGTDGVATVQLLEQSIGFGVTVDADGKILVTGQATQPFQEGGTELSLTRFNADGTLDTTFGGGTGSTLLEVGFQAAGFSVAVDEDGRIVAGGTGNANDTQGWLVARFDPNGALDTTFNAPSGFNVVASGEEDVVGQIDDLELDEQGRIVGTGPLGPNLATTQFWVGRFLSDGAADPSFGDDGLTESTIASFAFAERLVIQPDGKIVIAGQANVGGTFEFALARYLGEPSTIIPVPEARILETRVGPGFTTIDGEQQGIGRRSAGQTTTIDVGGRANVPDDAHAAVLTAAAIDPAAQGYITLFDCDDSPPNSSTLNHPAGGARANSAIVELGDDGTVCAFTLRATDLVVDVTAYVNADGDITTFDGQRILETRQGPGFTTADGQQQGIGRRAFNQTTVVDVAGRLDIPDEAIAGIFNIAAVDAGDQGFVSAYSCDDVRPNASTLNHAAGDTIANGALLELSDDGQLCVYTQQPTDLVIDVTGFVLPQTDVITRDPSRIAETRIGSAFQTIDGEQEGIGRRTAGQVTQIPVAGRAGIPEGAVTGIFNVAAINPSEQGFLTIYDCDDERPNTSTVNFTAGEVIANRAIVALDGDGAVCVYTHQATDFVLDITGYTI